MPIIRITLVIVAACIAVSAQTSCTDFNKTVLSIPIYASNSSEHAGIPFGEKTLYGTHDFSSQQTIKCTYTKYGSNQCIPTTVSTCSKSGGERYPGPGDIDPPNRVHRDGYNCQGEVHFGSINNGDEPWARVVSSWVVVSCLNSDLSCTYTSIGYDSLFNPLFTDHFGSSGHRLFTPGSWFNADKCDYQILTGRYSPIVIDLDGNNFANAFTDIDGGILWDFLAHGPGNEIQVAWTKPTANIGFLWLDRSKVGMMPTDPDFWPCYLAKTLSDCNGKVDSGKELFGNITPQTAKPGFVSSPTNPAQPNGFEALRTLDSNNDGKIDASDPVFNELRVWVDTCHCGDSTQGTNYRLSDLGITSISTSYTKTDQQDENGNLLQYKGTLTRNGVATTIYDVYFLGRQP